MIASVLFAVLACQAQTPVPPPPVAPPANGPVQTAPASPPPVAAPAVAPPAVVPAPDLSKPMVVVEANRLAITPFVDGTLATEEWDPMTVGDDSIYIEWEPGRLYFAGHLALGKDFVASLDFKGDGWLVGADNVEVKAHLDGDAPRLSIRRLVANDPQGPHWADMPSMLQMSKVAASKDANSWTVEIALDDGGVGLVPTRPGSHLSLRLDAIPAAAPEAPPFAPRAVTPVSLVFDRSAGLPPAVAWKPESPSRDIAPGGELRIRQTFRGNRDLALKTIAMRCEGPLRETCLQLTTPFSGFDRKGRAFVDYVSHIMPDTKTGYRVQRTTLTFADGIPSVLENSFRVSPLVEVDMGHKRIPYSATKRVVKIDVHLSSNTPGRVDGVFIVNPPQDWRVLSGSGNPFIIYNARGSVKRVFELEIPGDVEGIVPVPVVLDIGGDQISQTLWLEIKKK